MPSPDYKYTELPGNLYGVPRSLLGPTGNIFFHGNGEFSTHKNMVTGDVPGLEGQHAVIPTLVPGQVDIGPLLAGKPLTKEQRQIAQDYAGQLVAQGHPPPAFSTPNEALTFEKQWHTSMSEAQQRFFPQVTQSANGRTIAPPIKATPAPVMPRGFSGDDVLATPGSSRLRARDAMENLRGMMERPPNETTAPGTQNDPPTGVRAI